MENSSTGENAAVFKYKTAITVAESCYCCTFYYGRWLESEEVSELSCGHSGRGSRFDYKDHIVLHLCGKCQTVDLCNNLEKKKKGKATRISVKVRDILEFHNFQILLCEQEKAKRSFSPPILSTPKTMTHEQLWLTFMSSVSCASAWWTAGERTPVGSSASWYLGLALKSTAASFVPPDLGVF